MSDAHVQIGIPDVPNGVVVIPLVSNEDTMRSAVVAALKTATIVREKYLGTFPEAVKPKPENEREEPRGRQRAPKCPRHNSPMKSSRSGGWYCPRQDRDTGDYCEEKFDG